MWIAVLAGIAEVVVGLDVVVAVVLVVVVVVVVVEVVVVLTTAQAEVNTTVVSTTANRFVMIPPQTSLGPRGHLGQAAGGRSRTYPLPLDSIIGLNTVSL